MCATGDGTVLVERTDGTLVSVNPAGKTIWSRSGAGRGERRTGGLPVVCGPDGIVYRVEQESRLVALTPRGSPVWSIALEAAVEVGPIAVGGSVVLADVEGTVLAIHPSGALRWRFEGQTGVRALSASATGGVLVATANGRVLELIQGRPAARWALDGVTLAGVRAAGGPLAGYARGSDGSIYALTRAAVVGDGDLPDGHSASERGAQLRARRLDVGSVVAAAILPRAGGGLFVLSSDGGVWVIGEGAEQTAGRAAPIREAAAPTPSPGGRAPEVNMAVSDAGRVVVTGPGWTVAAHRLETGILSPPRVPAGTAARGQPAAERPHTGEIDRIYLSRLLRSRDPGDQGRALAEIATRVEEAELAGSYHLVLEELTAFARNRRHGLAERVRAVRMLARIGGYGTRDALVRLARDDADREIRLAVLESIAVLSVDRDGRTARMIHEVLREEARRAADMRLGRAGLSAIRGYVSYRGAVDSADLGEAIGILATAGFPREIASRAAGLARELY
jgi:hypothetical protein